MFRQAVWTKGNGVTPNTAVRAVIAPPPCFFFFLCSSTRPTFLTWLCAWGVVVAAVIFFFSLPVFLEPNLEKSRAPRSGKAHAHRQTVHPFFCILASPLTFSDCHFFKLYRWPCCTQLHLVPSPSFSVLFFSTLALRRLALCCRVRSGTQVRHCAVQCSTAPPLCCLFVSPFESPCLALPCAALD